MIERVGTWRTQVRRFPDGTIVGMLENRKLVKVKPTTGREFVPGVSYIFYGYDGGYKDKRNGEYVEQFQVKHYKIHEPISRTGVGKYLMRYARGCGLGPTTINELCNAYGSNVVAVIRKHPDEASHATSRWSIMQAEKAAEMLNRVAGLEHTRMELVELLGGRGFPLSVVDRAIDRWQLLAIETIKTNPYILLIEGISGCGFMRCDKLWLDLGKDPHDMSRQMFAIWHTLTSDSSGNTWVKVTTAVQLYQQKISETVVDPKEAIKHGITEGWLSIHVDDRGVAWIAAGDRDRAEAVVATRVLEMIRASQEEIALLA